MSTLLPCKRSKYIKQFVIISILQNLFHLSCCLALLSKVGRLLPDLKLHRSDILFREALADGCIQHVSRALIVK